MPPRLLAVALLALVLSACSAPAALDTAPTPTSAPEQDAGQGEDTAPRTVVVWARYGMPMAAADAARGVDGVAAAMHVRSGTADLLGSRDASGTPVDNPGDRWRIPVATIAIDPSRALAVMADHPSRSDIADLTPDGALLPRSSAERRGLDVGAEIDLAGGATLTIAAIVDDAMFGSDEIIVHADIADRIGLRENGATLLRLLGAVTDTVRDRLVALGPAGLEVRVDEIDPSDPTAVALVLGLPEIKHRFGEFRFRDDTAIRDVHPDPAWVAEHITIDTVPILGRVRCHRAILDDLRDALQAIDDAGLAGEINRRQYGGCYHPRRMGSHTQSLSRHSWGIAIDINVDMNVPGRGHPPHPRIIEIFASHGFRWGGVFLAPDNHHFEWVGDDAGAAPPPIGIGATPRGMDADPSASGGED